MILLVQSHIVICDTAWQHPEEEGNREARMNSDISLHPTMFTCIHHGCKHILTGFLRRLVTVNCEFYRNKAIIRV